MDRADTFQIDTHNNTQARKIVGNFYIILSSRPFTNDKFQDYFMKITSGTRLPFT